MITYWKEKADTDLNRLETFFSQGKQICPGEIFQARANNTFSKQNWN